LIESKLTENPKSDDAGEIKKFYERVLSIPKIPAELEPLSSYIVCNSREKFPLKVDAKDEKIKVNAVNIKDLLLDTVVF